MTYVVISPTNVVGAGQVGGHLWVYAQYAAALRDAGCRVGWLERFDPTGHTRHDRRQVEHLRARLFRLGAADEVCLYRTGTHGPQPVAAEPAQLERMVSAADLLLNFDYRIDVDLAQRFSRRALVDIDPGLLQFWVSVGQLPMPAADHYFTTGETVGTPATTRIPDCGVTWHHIRPPVCLRLWPPTPASSAEAFTTVSSWWGGAGSGEWITDGKGLVFENNKRVSFLAHADLPTRTSQRLELALAVGHGDDHLPPTVDLSEWTPQPDTPKGTTSYIDDATDVALLRRHGWRVRSASQVAGSPEQYRRYVQSSKGEFSCAKPSCGYFQNAWISDRTVCYLATGKPAVVEHTGASSYLPDGEGLLRFHSTEQAAEALETVGADYRRHCAAARSIAETYFDATPIVASILDTALARPAPPPLPGDNEPGRSARVDTHT